MGVVLQNVLYNIKPTKAVSKREFSSLDWDKTPVYYVHM